MLNAAHQAPQRSRQRKRRPAAWQVAIAAGLLLAGANCLTLYSEVVHVAIIASS
ncbi:MAG: hypothetical protein QOF37_2866, partial [Thermoleophilaceae bacterium]|nr:hypothetical protein [Thermoleophilaceae bacterium]